MFYSSLFLDICAIGQIQYFMANVKRCVVEKESLNFKILTLSEYTSILCLNILPIKICISYTIHLMNLNLKNMIKIYDIF